MKRIAVALLFVCGTFASAQQQGYGPPTTACGATIVNQTYVDVSGGLPGVQYVCRYTPGTNTYAWKPSTPVIPTNITITVGTTAIPANSCTSAFTASMPGLTGSMTTTFSPASPADVSTVTGWSPASTGQLYFSQVQEPTGTLGYRVCNGTSSSITPGASTTWNVSAK